MKRYIGLFVLLVALLLGVQAPTYASSVSSTFSTSNATSSTLTVPAGERARVNLAGTWVATVKVQISFDAGASYQDLRSDTSNYSEVFDAQTRNAIYRLATGSFTSGTITYELANVPATVVNRSKFTNVPLPPIANYAALGTNPNTLVVGSMYVTDVVVGRDMSLQGVAVLNGGTCGTSKWVAWVFNSDGTAVANTAVAGATCSGANTFQEIAVTNPLNIPAGVYYVGLKTDNATDNWRVVPLNSTIGLRVSYTTHTSALIGSFGSTIRAIPVPTAAPVSSNVPPIVYLYGTNQ